MPKTDKNPHHDMGELDPTSAAGLRHRLSIQGVPSWNFTLMQLNVQAGHLETVQPPPNRVPPDWSWWVSG
jgi:hypothetical protein